MASAEHKDVQGKERITLVPPEIIRAIARVREYGLKKYPDSDWRQVPADYYLDAMLRHSLSLIEGNNLDDESGLPHLWHIATNVAFLIELSKGSANAK